ncbi:hypothetical protein, partial [Microcoleus sp. herbarium14]|uniref:hypothetical protein n=1 Tax=Microcoleus sp. herbarium14 TaxID=3055439 RepID=UPI002FD57C84
GRRKKEEGRRKKEEGRRNIFSISPSPHLPLSLSPSIPISPSPHLLLKYSSTEKGGIVWGDRHSAAGQCYIFQTYTKSLFHSL